MSTKPTSNPQSQLPFSQPQPQGSGRGAQRAPRPSHSRPQQQPAPEQMPIGVRGPPPGYTGPERPELMPHAFAAPSTPVVERPRTQYFSMPNSTPHGQPMAARGSRQAYSAQPLEVPGAALLDAMYKTDAQMREQMGRMGQRGYLWLTRLGATLSVVGGGAAAAGVVLGGAAAASGIGLPVGALAALAGVGVLVGGLALSALLGAAARKMARSAIADDPMLQHKIDVLKQMRTSLRAKPRRTLMEEKILRDVETLLRRVDDSFGAAIKRTTKSVIKAPFAALIGSVVLVGAIGSATSPLSGIGGGSGGVSDNVGWFGSSEIDLELRGHDVVPLTPELAHMLNELSA